MGGVVKSIFGGAPEPAGPDEELISLQKQQISDNKERQEKEDRKLRQNRKVAQARSGQRSGGVTLNTRTGEAGVSDTLGNVSGKKTA